MCREKVQFQNKDNSDNLTTKSMWRLSRISKKQLVQEEMCEKNKKVFVLIEFRCECTIHLTNGFLEC